MRREIRCQAWKVVLSLVCAVGVGVLVGTFLGMDGDGATDGKMVGEVQRCMGGLEECQQALLTLSVMLRSLPPEATLADLSSRVHSFMNMQAQVLLRLEEIGVDATKVQETRDAWNDASARLLSMGGLDPNSMSEFSVPPGRSGAVFLGPALLD